MSSLANFDQNLRVWSRRMKTRNLGPLAEKIAQSFGNIPLGRQAAIKAVAMEWFATRGLSRELCKDCAAVAAVDVYQGVYYPMEKAPAIGLDESIIRNKKASGLLAEFCQEAREAYRREKSGLMPAIFQNLKSPSEAWDD